nr:MAG TPA: hypothetical protein [Caudoviricetes sp.]
MKSNGPDNQTKSKLSKCKQIKSKRKQKEAK